MLLSSQHIHYAKSQERREAVIFNVKAVPVPFTKALKEFCPSSLDLFVLKETAVCPCLFKWSRNIFSFIFLTENSSCCGQTDHFLHVYPILDSVAMETQTCWQRICIPAGDL